MHIFSLFIVGIVASSMARADAENFLPVSLKCPHGSAGSMELVLKNGQGVSQRVSGELGRDGFTKVKVEEALPGRGFSEKLSFDLRRPLSNRDQSFADKILLTLDGYRQDGCPGGKVSKKLEKEFARNRRDLKTRSVVSESADEDGAVSGE